MSWIFLKFSLGAFVLCSSREADSTDSSLFHILGGWHGEEFTTELTIMIFLICVIILRVIYHHVPPLAKWVPESLILLITGVVFGGFLRLHFQRTENEEDSTWQLTPKLFFRFLLPPIILDSAYAMYNTIMKDNLGGILLYAVIGTLLNFGLFVAILSSVHYAGIIGKPDHGINMKSILLLSAIIVAVDPVAVMAIFQAVGVDLGLYFIVFGESLFNDAVTVVLYTVVSAFPQVETFPVGYYFIATLSFFTISFGGMLVGLATGVLTCLLTRPKSSLGGAIVLVLGYFSYVIADCLEWSGIISMITCGLVQTIYAFHNISRTSVLVVRRLTKLTSEISESVIFLFIGVQLLSRDFVWHTGFHCWTMLACLVARTISVLLLTTLINRAELASTKISMAEQVVLICGGMRGAVCFCLSLLIKPEFFATHSEYKRQLITTATLFVICVTVGLIGLTLKPLIYWLNIPMRRDNKLSLFKGLNQRVIEEMMCTIEVIVGTKGRNVIRDIWENVDQRFIRPVLQRDPQTHEQRFVELYERIALRLHYAMVQPGKSAQYLNQLDPVNQVYTTAGAPSKPETIHVPEPCLIGRLNTTEDALRSSSFQERGNENEGRDSPRKSKRCPCKQNCCPRFYCKTPKEDESVSTDLESVSYITADSKTFTDMTNALLSRRHASRGKFENHGTEFADTFVDMLLSKSLIARDNAIIHPRSSTTQIIQTPFNIPPAYVGSSLPAQTVDKKVRRPLLCPLSACCCCQSHKQEIASMSYESTTFYMSSDSAYAMHNSPEQSARMSLCDAELHLALKQEEQDYYMPDTRSRRISSILLSLPAFDVIQQPQSIVQPMPVRPPPTGKPARQKHDLRPLESSHLANTGRPFPTRPFSEPPLAFIFTKRHRGRAPSKKGPNRGMMRTKTSDQ